MTWLRPTGIFAGARLWRRENSRAYTTSPAPWDIDAVFPHVIEIEYRVPNAEDGDASDGAGSHIWITVTHPCDEHPDDHASLPEWRALFQRAASHEADEALRIAAGLSAPFDPHGAAAERLNLKEAARLIRGGYVKPSAIRKGLVIPSAIRDALSGVAWPPNEGPHEVTRPGDDPAWVVDPPSGERQTLHDTYRAAWEARLRREGCWGHLRMSEYRYCARGTKGCHNPAHGPLRGKDDL